jgi:beta-galactosidase/beta-glucuronidase
MSKSCFTLEINVFQKIGITAACKPLRALQLWLAKPCTVILVALSKGPSILRALLNVPEQVTTSNGTVGTPFNVSLLGARLWSPKDPHLYNIHATLSSNLSPDAQVRSAATVHL